MGGPQKGGLSAVVARDSVAKMTGIFDAGILEKNKTLVSGV